MGGQRLKMARWPEKEIEGGQRKDEKPNIKKVVWENRVCRGGCFLLHSRE